MPNSHVAVARSVRFDRASRGSQGPTCAGCGGATRTQAKNHRPSSHRNYHAAFPVDHKNEAELETAEKVNAEIVDYALKRGGICTGEHGIGSGKTRHLKKEHGDSLPFMRNIKGLADPNGIMNPGKIFSDEERQMPEEIS